MEKNKKRRSQRKRIRKKRDKNWQLCWTGPASQQRPPPPSTVEMNNQLFWGEALG
jgi:hypothetical protein